MPGGRVRQGQATQPRRARGPRMPPVAALRAEHAFALTLAIALAAARARPAHGWPHIKVEMAARHFWPERARSGRTRARGRVRVHGKCAGILCAAGVQRALVRQGLVASGGDGSNGGDARSHARCVRARASGQGGTGKHMVRHRESPPGSRGSGRVFDTSRSVGHLN